MSPNVVQEELDRAERRYRSLIDNCVDGLVVIDEKGIILEFNPSAERIFGHEANEVVGRSVGALMPEPERSNHDRYISGYVAGGQAKIIGIGREVRGLRKNGESFPMHLSVGEISDGRNRSFMGLVQDLTRQKTVEAQLLQASKMEAVGRLTGGIAHDFNNLLAVLTMDLEMLADLGPDNAERSELLTEALDMARAGAELTHRLLAFSRRQPLTPSVVNISEMALSLAGLLHRTIGEDVRIDAVGSPNAWPISVDRGQLENAIVNLAINARDSMPNGGRLELKCGNVSLGRGHPFADLPPGDYVRLDVTDTGEGMSPETAARAFEPLFTTKESGRGTGLGLSMVYGFAKQSGGDASIRSEPGKGATVTLHFPRADAERGGRKADAADLPTGTECVLLVEDDQRTRKRTAETLRNLGYAVKSARNGMDARRRLRSGEVPDLLVTDAVMPGKWSGVVLAEHVARYFPGIPILLLTGYDDETLRARPAGVLRKPFTRKALAQAVRRAIDGRRRVQGVKT